MGVRSINGKASWGKTYRGFAQALAEAGKHLTKQGATILSDACESWLQDVDSQWPRGSRNDIVNLNTGKVQRTYGAYASGYRGGDKYFPWYTGNLHDSLATVVTDGNRVVGIRQMQPGATVAQYDETNGIIDGTEWGLLVANRAAHVLLGGVQAKLVIGVPYAQKVDEMPEHAGYVHELEVDFASTMENALNYEFGRTKNLIIR